MNVNITECIHINRNEDKNIKNIKRVQKTFTKWFFREKQNRQLNVEQFKVE